MNKIDELMTLLQKKERDDDKCKNTIIWIWLL